jgi:hypothetical protein
VLPRQVLYFLSQASCLSYSGSFGIRSHFLSRPAWTAILFFFFCFMTSFLYYYSYVHIMFGSFLPPSPTPSQSSYFKLLTFAGTMHMYNLSSFFLLIWGRYHELYCLDWVRTSILLISASCIAWDNVCAIMPSYLLK